MMISVGNKCFIEGGYIVDILKAEDNQAKVYRYAAAISGRLINVSGGKRIRSVVILKSKHIVLSSLRMKTIKLRLIKVTATTATENTVRSRPKLKRKTLRSKTPEFDDRRKEPERRHFSYSHCIPERRSGTERRGDNGKFQCER